MNANKSIEELKDAISEQKADMTYTGDIKISEYLYKLENININQSERRICTGADLIDPPRANENHASIIGCVVLIALYDGISETGKGELTINANGFSGVYTILLSKQEHNPA